MTLLPSLTCGADPLDLFVECAGFGTWKQRLAGFGRPCGASGTRAGRALLQRHAIELIIERLRCRPDRAPGEAETRILTLAADAVVLMDGLTEAGRDRLAARLRAALTGDGTLVGLFHLLRTARMQRDRGFTVDHAGLEDDAPFDLLIRRDGVEAEIACDVMSAEDGRFVNRGAWYSLVDRVDPELQTWLAAHPGRYLLKLTLPQGLKQQLESEGGLAELHRRITAMLSTQRRADHDEAAVLRLDPLLLTGAKADELGLVSRLRRDFGPEAHLSVTAAGGGVFVMAARGGSENEVAAAVRRRLSSVAPARLTGSRPGIVAMFIEDVDRQEWHLLRDRMDLEGEARKFLTSTEARRVVAVTCTSRLELFGTAEPDALADGELRFRNPSHPAAKALALAPAVLSTV